MAIKLTSAGSSLPKNKITNDELEDRLSLEYGWIKQRTGIENRHVLNDDSFLDHACDAAFKAIERAHLKAQEIELIIIATTTPPQIMPSTALLIQKELGISHCFSFDVQAACSGFTYGLIIAESLMLTNHLTNALVMGCDAYSKITNYDDPKSGIVFGDGFGAVILENEKVSNEGFVHRHAGSDSSGVEFLQVPWGVAQGYETLDQSNGRIKMDGKSVFKFAVQSFSQEIQFALDQSNLPLDKIKYIITHQANQRIIDSVSVNLDIPKEKFAVTLKDHGNTSSASIPMTLDHYLINQLIQPGDLLLLTGLGAGYVFGSVIIEYAPNQSKGA